MHLQILAVAVGGMSGAVVRYWIVYFIGVTAFPWATLLVNLAGSFLIGLWYAVSQHVSFTTEWRLFFQMGLLGAFTTFSALSLELLGMLETRQFVSAFIYIVSSIVGGVTMAYAGFLLYKVTL